MHHTRTIDENIDAAKYVGGLTDEGINVLFPGNVCGDTDGFPAKVPDGVDSLFQPGCISSSTGHIRTGLGQTDGDFTSEALTGTNDQGFFVFKAKPVPQGL